jgi:hypothetical protein
MILMGQRSHGDAIAHAAGIEYKYGVDPIISRVTSEGNLMGGVIYQGYTGKGGSIGMHVGAFKPNWVNRDLLWVCFDYPFNQLEVNKIFGLTPATNKVAMDFNYNLGFTYETSVRDVFADGDMVVLSMYRKDCRWLKVKPRTLQPGSVRNVGEHLNG